MRQTMVAVLFCGLGGIMPAQTPPTPPTPPASPAPPAVRMLPTPPAAPAPPVLAQAQAAPAPPLPPDPPARRGKRVPGLLFAQASTQSYLGVHLLEVNPERAAELGMGEPYGVEIMSVAPKSPAAAAGLRKGDVLIEYRGQRVEGTEHLVRLVRETPIGRQVPVTVLRSGAPVKLNVDIGERKVASNTMFNCGEEEPCEIRIPSIQMRSFDFDIPKPRMVTQSRLLGAELEGLDGQLAEYFGVQEGVLVRSIDGDSPASRAGLKAGDIIVQIAGKNIRDPGQIREVVRSIGSEEKVPLSIVRNRSKLSLQMEPQSRDLDSRNREGRRVVEAPGRF